MNSRKLLEKITEKWHVKIISLAAAIIISVFYRMNSLEVRHFTVPLRAVESEQFTPVDSYTSSVRISLRGEAGKIHPILEEDIEAYIDLNRFTAEGTYRIPVQIRKKDSAIGIEPLEISVAPIEVQLAMEEKVSRNIPVFPVFQGKLASGYELASQTLIPNNVIAEGPRSSLDNQYEFFTGPIDIDGRFEDFSVLVNISNSNPLVKIHGNRMVEYRCTIHHITREPQADDEELDLSLEIDTGDSEE